MHRDGSIIISKQLLILHKKRHSVFKDFKEIFLFFFDVFFEKT
uniref:Uncharacterized protein n=1 Tax=Siphoviridae sp. ctgmM3 TaxID=2827912 RepID=A0A8S5TJH9_9CAUD|nr:MAG TPA: hypothetical protein [Siphoviridae sp. ctgmM3]